MKTLARHSLTALLLATPLSAGAVLLDCEIDARRVYTCIEISDRETPAATQTDSEPYDETYNRYMEEARQSCVYREPRRRTSGKNTGMALRSEERKSAREEYDRCVRDKARALWRQHPTQGAPAATGE